MHKLNRCPNNQSDAVTRRVAFCVPFRRNANMEKPPNVYVFGGFVDVLFAGFGKRRITAERDDVCAAVEPDDLNRCFFVGFFHGIHPPVPIQLPMPIAARYATSASWNAYMDAAIIRASYLFTA